MVRLLLLTLMTTLLAGCSPDERPAATAKPLDPTTRALIRIAEGPAADLEARWPDAPRGFTRADRDQLADWLVGVARRALHPPAANLSDRAALDHAFAAIDMRSRVDFARTVERASRRYGSMPLAWAFADQFEPRAQPPRAGRIIRARWAAEDDRGWFTLHLRATYAYVSPDGRPMLITRGFSLASQDPDAGPAQPVWIGFHGTVHAIDRCHVVRTGRLRPSSDPDEIAQALRRLRTEARTGAKDDSDADDFTAGCR